MSFLSRLWQLSRRPCPRCGARALQTRGWIRATLADPDGRRYPDSWTYESCGSCGDRTKRYLDGRVEAASEEEWRTHAVDG